MPNDPMSQLADTLSGARKDRGPTSRQRQCVITAVDGTTATATVTVSGGDLEVDGVHYLTGYAPKVGDTVWAVGTGKDLIIRAPVSPSGIARGEVNRSTNQTISNNTQQAVQFDVEAEDTDAMVNLGANNTRITAQREGRYQVAGGVTFVSNATGRRILSIYKNGSEVWRVEHAPVNGATTTMGITRPLSLAVTDYVELVAFQTSTANLDLSTAATYMRPWMTAHRVH